MELQKNSEDINSVEQVFAQQAKRRAWWWEAARLGIIAILGAVTLLQTTEIGRLRGYMEGISSLPVNAAVSAAAIPSPSAGQPAGLPSQVGGC